MKYPSNKEVADACAKKAQELIDADWAAQTQENADERLQHQPRRLRAFDSAHLEEQIRQISSAVAAREIEALKLYVPTRLGAEFHECRAKERALRGGNQSGKSTAAVVEFARCVLNQDPYGKYPQSGLAVIVGYDQEHLGGTLHRLLFEPGAFRIIRDLTAGQWRSYNPLDPADVARIGESRPAPPVIPKRFTKKITWENAGEHVFSVVQLHTGWEIRAYSSRAVPPQGFKADYVWFDEDIERAEWPDEIQFRVVAKSGWFVWSAMPQCRNKALLTMARRAWDDAKDNSRAPDVAEFHFKFKANPHISDDDKRKAIKALSYGDPRIMRMRVEGEFTLDEFKVFPEFSMALMGRDPFNPEHVEFGDNGQLPKEWCRFIVIDPGFTIGAVLFAAVPPPRFGDFVYLEDELYIAHCTSDLLAESMAQKMEGRSYYAKIIDMHGSARTEVSGVTIREQYARAFRKCRVRTECDGFILGCDDKRLRLNACHDWMHIRPDGTTKVRVVKGRLPNFEKEIDEYMKKRNGNIVLEEPDDRENAHLMHDFQYLAACAQVRYVKPEAVPRHRNPIAEYAREKQRKKRQGKGSHRPATIQLGPVN